MDGWLVGSRVGVEGSVISLSVLFKVVFFNEFYFVVLGREKR